MSIKLISVNVEHFQHKERIFTLLKNEKADVVCLMEFPEKWCTDIQAFGYHITFAAMCFRSTESDSRTGVAFASLSPHTASTDYYYKSASEITLQQSRVPESSAHPVILGTLQIKDVTYRVAATHMIVTADGKENDHQRAGTEKLLSILENKPPHVLCGDFNIPRGYNQLYERITEKYKDAIPPTYGSSLDKSLHRLGTVRNLNQAIFEEYMVDYIFTQSPYTARDVRLIFGVSDHAAAIAHIERK